MEIERRDELAILRMDEGKANAIGPQLLARLDEALGVVEAEPPRALVLTGAGRHFCAGLDLATMNELSEGEMGAFVARFERVFVRAFLLPCPVVAAVNGSAVAGGCVLALAADHRVAAAGDYKIGLNEARVGVSFPSIALEVPRCQLTPPAFQRAVLGGELVVPQQALALGLVDEIVEPGALLDRALERGRELARSPRDAFATVKREVRQPFVARVREHGGESRAQFVRLWTSDEAREMRAAVLARVPR